MPGSELQEPSPIGARLADSEERQRRFTVQPLRRLFRVGGRVTAGADRELARGEPGQRRALHLGRGAFVVFLALAALLVLVVYWLWLSPPALPAGPYQPPHVLGMSG